MPTNFPEFASLVKKCLVLEFIIVTVVKPIMMIPEPEKLLKWHKETERNKVRSFKKKVEKPEYNEVFTSPRFAGFCHLYFKIATALGAFQVFILPLVLLTNRVQPVYSQIRGVVMLLKLEGPRLPKLFWAFFI